MVLGEHLLHRELRRIGGGPKGDVMDRAPALAAAQEMVFTV
jgi:hypothetical protein